MKWIAPVILALITISACGGEGANSTKTEHTGSLRIWTAPDTGCKYYMRRAQGYERGFGGMTPVLRADGKPDCPAVS